MNRPTISVYTADCTALESETLFRRYYERMPAWRKVKIDRLRFGKDKRLSLGAGVLLDRALRDAGITEPGETVAFGENGKPAFPACPDVRFNLSHAGTKVMAAVAPFEVGCDVERIGAGELSVAERFFAPEETAFIRNLPTKEEQETLFCRIWTLKESFMKATGLGFSLPLGDFAVDVTADPIRIRRFADGHTYRFREWDPGDGYRYALASQDEPDGCGCRLTNVNFEEILTEEKP